MNTRPKVDVFTFTRYFTLLMGIAFVAAGIAGFLPFFTPPVAADAPELILDSNYGRLLGLFPVNSLHSIFHFSVGVYGLLSFRAYLSARKFCQAFGITLAILTVMGLIPSLNTGFGYLPLYSHDIWLHGLEAIVAIYLGFVTDAKV